VGLALRALNAAIFSCFLLLSRVAQADPLPVELSWDAPSECPSHEEVMAELARITRVKPGRALTAINAQATIEHASDGRYHLRLRTQREDQAGDTDLDATTCAVLKRGVTLVLALALGDGVDLVDEKSAPPEAAPEPPKPIAPPPKPAPLPPPPSPKPDRGLHWAPWLAGSAAWGLSAKPAFAPQIGLAVGHRHWQALAQLSYAPPRSAPRVQGIDSSYNAFVGALGACARLPLAMWSLAGCGVFELGVVHGRSGGAFQDGSATAPWYAAGPLFVLTAPLAGGVALRAAGGFSIGFDPPHFAIRGLRDVYVVSRVVPAVSLGFSL